MKYIYLYIILLSFLTSCQYTDISNQFSPTNDTTKLWPAYDTENNLYGYIDQKGEFKIKGQYEYNSLTTAMDTSISKEIY